MSNAEIGTHDLEKKSRLRYRNKFENKKKYREEMVGFGHGESLSKALADVTTELTVYSDDSSDDQDTSRLISSSSLSLQPRVSFEESKKNGIKTKRTEIEKEDENVWTISVQMFIPFLLAGFGMVAASLLLDVVQVCIIKCLFIIQFQIVFFLSKVKFFIDKIVYFKFFMIIDCIFTDNNFLNGNISKLTIRILIKNLKLNYL